MGEKTTDIVLYTAANGKAQLEVNIKDETIWLSQAQIAELFDIQRPAITKHLRNKFKEGELVEKSVCSILEHTATDGKKYKTQYYNLDAVISVGYRVNSKQATQFRIWATSVLREYVLKGVVVNEKRLKTLENLSQLEKTVSLLQSIVHTKSLSMPEALRLLSVITEYAHTWIVLQEYDDGLDCGELA